MNLHDWVADAILEGPTLPEPVRLIQVTPLGHSWRVLGTGLRSQKIHDRIYTAQQMASFTVTPPQASFTGRPRPFKLAVEAHRLGLAHAHDPFFSLSIARIDPLPHQLEAVYDYFLRQPRIRFLLADDPGAGKTIMAGLLLKELKTRRLVRRTLILTPANLTFQWQREMSDKFRESFQVVRGEVLRATYGRNPWADDDQVITSLSWVSVIEDARQSLLRSHWDLVIVDEAHKMSNPDTLAHKLGAQLAQQTHHLLLMTATPHKGDPEQFRAFLQLLDADVYADLASLQLAMHQQVAPFYLRRTKEALVTFPDPTSGQVRRIYPNRYVETVTFDLSEAEFDFYERLTAYVEDQSVRASQDSNQARGRALGFTMAMLQRRFASSLRAVRRSLERMLARREDLLKHPAKLRQATNISLDLDERDDLDDDEREAALQALERVAIDDNRQLLRQEIRDLQALIDHARQLEARQQESKFISLLKTLEAMSLGHDPTQRLLIFTEHRDTLDDLVEKLQQRGFRVAQIHGGMKIGDPNSPGTRLHAEKMFKEDCQIMVATEAAGEGINLQFCWRMINYDIPWNPARLEQRMGRIHRYGQERDCHILNFVSHNTREGRVLSKLFERMRQIEQDLDPQRSGKVFNVLGEIFPANQLERLLREMYARQRDEASIQARIVADVDKRRFERILQSTLEGLARRQINLVGLLGRMSEARERRLMPEAVEAFFIQAAQLLGLPLQALAGRPVYRLGKLPEAVRLQGAAQRERCGPLADEYRLVSFDKASLQDDPSIEWLAPDHPLFEAVRAALLDEAAQDMRRGAVFYDGQAREPVLLDVFRAAIEDGLNHVLDERLFVVETRADGSLSLRPPSLFLDLIPAQAQEALPDHDASTQAQEAFLIDQGLVPLLETIQQERSAQIARVRQHVQVSLDAIIDHLQALIGKLDAEGGQEGLRAIANQRYEQAYFQREARLQELIQEEACSISDLTHLGRAWVLPCPPQAEELDGAMRRDEEVERRAVQVAWASLEAEGWQVVSVERDNLGYDLRAIQGGRARFVEVKGRAALGTVSLTPNEYQAAQRLGADYWLYVVYDCATQPRLYRCADPVRLGWQPVQSVERYLLDAQQIMDDEG
jgi:superfamily II DNA or RNA helicase